MHQEKLIHEIASEVGMSRADAEHVLNIITNTIINSISHGEKVELDGFGNFFSKPLSAYTQRKSHAENANILAFQQSTALENSINNFSQ